MYKDILFDYLLGDMPEYLEILQNSQEDINPIHWKRYTTCYGNFIHFINIYTGEIL